MRAFFFAPESPRPVALVRIAVGLVFLYDAAVRWPYAIELYSSAGLPMPVFPAGGAAGTALAPPVLGAAATVLLHSLLVFSLAAVTLGWRTRLSLAVALGLSLWFGLIDHAGTFKKYSVIGAHLMLLLSFSRCSAAWSIDRRLDPRSPLRAPLSAAWPRRLMQVLVVAVYLGAAVTKLHLPDFANGDLLMFSLLDDQWGGTRLGLWLATRPKLLILASMATVLFEVAFPLLVWVGRARRTMLLLAAGFHLMLAATMSLGIFSFAMLAALLAFVDERDLQALRRIGTAAGRRTGELREKQGGGHRRRPLRASLASLGTFLAAGAVFSFGGLWIQRARDAYGVFGDRSPAALRPITDERMDSILAARPPAYPDYFHRVEIGSRLSADGTHAFGRRRWFERGMTVYGCARLIRKHPAMRLDWVLVRPDGAEARHSHRLARSSTHATVGFALTDPGQTPAGRYRLLLRADGYDVAECTFELIERSGDDR